ncbi:hypothetical protein BBJ28_00020517 [Nothophytophthora sp. Chile5]|nr:hypothetical protein BBJ28_00020517 [Nothophytophthora sp. Chile5]
MNEWEYNHCPSGEACVAHGVDSRCSKVRKIRHHHHHKRAHTTDSGSGSHSGNSTDEAVIYAITVADWQDCTLEIVGCESNTSVCVHQSEYYAQCKPAELPSGGLCGQSDGVSEWLYDHCPTGETCEKDGPDFRCTKKSHHKHHKHHEHHEHHKHHKLSAHKDTKTTAEDWQDCTKKSVTCKNKTSVCVKHSEYYSQCKPATLPSGDLCGQSDVVNKWKYDHCPSGESCKAKGEYSRCVKK